MSAFLDFNGSVGNDGSRGILNRSSDGAGAGLTEKQAEKTAKQNRKLKKTHAGQNPPGVVLKKLAQWILYGA